MLLSHGDIWHVGALPYIYKRMELSCPVYATIPVANYAPLSILDALRARSQAGPFDLFDAEDVDRVFEGHCAGLRFLQNVPLAGPAAKGIHVIPYAAGRTLGGAVWRIRKETDDILYAVDYNHRKERHLNGSVLDTLVRPTLLITDTRNALSPQVLRKQRDAELIGMCLMDKIIAFSVLGTFNPA